jgi:exonuclease III
MIESIPTLTFEVLSAALELRIFAQDKATPVNMAGASLTSETDFVGKWTLQEDMTYTQSLEGKSMEVKNIDSPIVTFNMPDYPEGFAAETLTLKLTDTEGNTMTRTLPEMTFVKGKRTVLNIVFTPDPVDDPEEPVNPDPEEPEVITGTFTCATYNVDGLPSIANSDGPGSSGTNSISAKLATSGWDFIGFQENFEYNSNLQSSMTSAYTFGTHRGSVGVSQLWGSKADTDGLNFATLNTTCSFSKEAYNSFNETYGGLTDGANTCIDKGFRYYLVTMADGVEFDIIVTHMNSGSDSGHISARASQMTQIATYINTIRSNNRPIIIIGDTNCRYTRDDMFQYLYNKLDSDLTYADPWVTYSWNGVYPTLGSASLMVPSKDSSSTFTEQTGEVVDKIIYINNPNSPTQIVAENYYNDEEYAGMADHNPVRATFTYTHTVTK